MNRQTLVLYPSKVNFQYADLGPMPWRQFKGYIQSLVDVLPENERETVKIDRAPAHGRGVEITYEHVLTAEEVMEDRRQKAIAWTQALPRELSEREEIKALKAILGL